MLLNLKLGNKQDLEEAQDTVVRYHYLHQRVDNRARPMVYLVCLEDKPVGLLMVGIPHATKCKGWWGYPGLPTQWQTLDLCRVWLDPGIQAGGKLAKPDYIPGFVDRQGVFRPTVASWAIGEMLRRVQRDRVSLWPPVYPDQPYHIKLLISYHDPRFHKGTIYKVMGFEPMYTDVTGPVTGSSGKFGWCWRLAEPAWKWSDIQILQPRTMRLAFL